MGESHEGSGGGAYVTVGELLTRRRHDLTPAERKVARALTVRYPLPGLETAGVSAPTVIRLVGKLGFDGYPDFQRALKAELAEQLSSPLAMYGLAEQHHAAGIGDTLRRASQTFEDGVRTSLAQVEPDDMLTVARLLADPHRRVATVGGRFSSTLARYLASHLQELRSATRHVSDSPADRALSLLDIGRKDVVVAFDFRRYQRDTVRFGTVAKQQGAKLVLITDPWLSPLASRADVVLQTSVSAPSPFDSLVPATALVEGLVAVLVEHLSYDPRPRLALLDAITQEVTIGLDEPEG
jgi:DNA-binding MurR/RpiR family transcriptional regulator